MKKITKKVIKTDYYDKFTCMADQCPFTCCQEWKITVDEHTYEKWEKREWNEAKKDYLSGYVKRKGGIDVIGLNEQKQCPFLNPQKLCNLVLRFGEEILSETCTSFPRQTHEFEDRMEYSLVSCCPAVVDIWNNQDKIGFTQEAKDGKRDILVRIRDRMIAIVQNQNFSISQEIMMIFYILLELYEKDTIPAEAIKEYEEDSALEKLADAINKMQFSMLDTFEEKNELFLDLAENYRKEKIYTAHLEDIALLAEELSQKYEKERMAEEIQTFEKLVSSYESLFRNYLVSEIYTNSLLPESDLESMVVMLQWIAMEYTTIKHAVFLRWKLDKSEDIAYTTVRNSIVVISRMTGYDQEDIHSYFENSFQNLIWKWGYLALIMGNCNC